MSTTDTAAITEMSFEAAMAALEDVVTKLESGSVGLEDSIALYERGALLKAHCEAKLAEAEARVAQITAREDGSVSADPIDIG
ncbi:MAG: exodeoxyribonuclease VII small subunit [Pseudomonadota bacterium]